jgi:hypothetical protein
LSPRRIEAKLKVPEIFRLRCEGYTFARIASMLGFANASGPWRALRRAVDRIDFDRIEQEKRKKST